LYVLDVEQVRAWRPAVTGVAEVLHARFVEHAYPLHTHDAWTLLIVDDGAIRFHLGRATHGAMTSKVTLLPPHVPHDGQAATGDGFRKRVLYLDTSVLTDDLIGGAVDRPSLADPPLRDRVDRLHRVLAEPGEAFEAESRLAFVRERLLGHFASGCLVRPPQPGLADRLRDLLDAHLPDGITLAEAAAELHAHPTHLVRSFTRRFGLPPHAYLTGRRVDLARRLLLAGHPAAEVANAAGFYDQSHLARHFKRYLAVSPVRYVDSHARSNGV
jgi:AraC-like DNA-binding protein